MKNIKTTTWAQKYHIWYLEYQYSFCWTQIIYSLDNLFNKYCIFGVFQQAIEHFEMLLVTSNTGKCFTWYSVTLYCNILLQCFHCITVLQHTYLKTAVKRIVNSCCGNLQRNPLQQIRRYRKSARSTQGDSVALRNGLAPTAATRIWITHSLPRRSQVIWPFSCIAPSIPIMHSDQLAVIPFYRME